MYSGTLDWFKLGLIDFFRNNNLFINSPVISSPGLSWLHFNSENKHSFLILSWVIFLLICCMKFSLELIAENLIFKRIEDDRY